MNECYKCKYRGTVPGDCHSCCKHPLVTEGDYPELENLLSAWTGIHSKAHEELEIEGDQYGREQGWFAWPINFDPVWLKNCNGFKSKDG